MHIGELYDGSVSPGAIDFFSIAGDMRLVSIVKPSSSTIAVQYRVRSSKMDVV